MDGTATNDHYFSLTIEASSPDTEIWLGDLEGHLVQKETGELRTSVLAGRYVVAFDLGGSTYPVDLTADRTYTEAEIVSGPACSRPKVKLLDADRG